ncbi:Hypothetical_protein [Hexamita inflata]|uniref:Hypothetical_protein n=1 Tax=Hexamita inflata TaxID=28002 RepID=A0AA86QBM6_9EUKA|nr:Hypothetical protein HINF_LOCUS37659 [Hexamita inflata]
MAQLLLFKQDLRHTLPVQFAVDNEDMRNLITHYNNGVNSVVEELPIELQTYDEFCEQVPVQQLNKTAQLYQMQKTYIDNCVRFAERLSLELDHQERFLNPFTEPLKFTLSRFLNYLKNYFILFYYSYVMQFIEYTYYIFGLLQRNCKFTRMIVNQIHLCTLGAAKATKDES